MSVVIPTRNRPTFLYAALSSLVHQSDSDFSVVVSDNSDDEESESISKEFSSRLKLRYQRSDRTLSMVDNWNFGVSVADAEYVAVMIDKTVWNSSVVGTVRKTIQRYGNVDVLSWSSEPYYGENEGCRAGLYVPAQGIHECTQQIDLLERLRERREFEVLRSAQSPNFYSLGKICFGVYGAPLIRKICNRHDRLFHPISPDYTSLALASLYSKNAVQLGVPMQLSFMTSIGNGYQAARNSRRVLDYLLSVDPQLTILARLPIPGLYQSIENCCAFDLIQFDDETNIELGLPNLCNLKKVISRETWGSRHQIDSSFVSQNARRDLMRRHRRLSTHKWIRRFVHPTQNVLALKVRSSRMVHHVHRAIQFMPGVNSILKSDESMMCESPNIALELQMQ